MATDSTGTGTARGRQDFEQALEASDTRQPVFEEEHRTPLKRLQHFLHVYPTAVPAIVLLIGIAFFSLLVGGRFLSAFNFSLVLQQVTIIGIVGLAQTLIVLTAGIDLSVGAIMVLSSVVMGKLAVQVGVPVPVAFLLGLALGALCGAINGALVAYFRLPPFIVTLGTWSIFFALNLWYSGSETIRSQDVNAAAAFLQLTATPFDFFGARLTVSSLLMVALFAVFWYVLNWTAFGRHLYAIGDDVDAARLAGIRTRPTLLMVYIVAGLICAIAGWALIGRIGAISPKAGYTTRQHHRRRDRRHQPVWRPRLDHRHADRRADRGSVPQRPRAVGRRRALAGVHRRPPDHRRRGDRSMDQEHLGMSPAPQAVLQARGLVKRYGRVTALDHADFDLLPGEILAVIGDNGAGKSTLIKAHVVGDGQRRREGEVLVDRSQYRLAARPGGF
jgi:fructose transport system permease protein